MSKNDANFLGGTMIPGEISQEKIIAHFFIELTKLGVKATGAAFAAPMKKLLEAYQKDFTPYLESTLKRCSQVKTLLHRDEPTELASIYVTTKLKCAKKDYDDYTFLDAIPELKNVVVAGTGGSGKSMFLRFVYQSLFEKSGGRIPLFIELRQMNTFQTKDLIAFIYHSVVTPGGVVTFDQFETGLQNGLFAIIVDGFDEVDFDWRKEIEQQLFSLREKYPNNILIVSSRPDDRFDAWTSFFVFRIQPMNQKQVISLIKKLDYDKEIRQKFIKNIQAGLYARHISFLSTPLLAVMMLITFDQFAHIPDKIHIFYEYAFDALFFKHDAAKHGGYRRKTQTGMPIDDFKNCLSSFCITTYMKEKFEFTDQEFRDFLQRALTFEKKIVDLEKFINDLLEAVCIFQRDGLHLTFTHRSFQEYFSAFFISRSPPVPLLPLLDQLCKRRTDTVIEMSHEMNKNLVEREWVLPKLKELTDTLNSYDLRTDFYGYLQTLYKDISIRWDSKSHNVYVEDSTMLGNVRFAFMKLYPDIYGKLRKKVPQDKKSYTDQIGRIVQELAEAGDERIIEEKNGKKKIKKKIRFNISEKDNSWLPRTWIFNFATEENAALTQLRTELERTATAGDDILGLLT